MGFWSNIFGKVFGRSKKGGKANIANNLRDLFSGRKTTRSNTINNAINQTKGAMNKTLANKPLNTREKYLLDSFSEDSDNPREKWEWYEPNSTWIEKAGYYKKLKKVVLVMKTKGGSKTYTYNKPVPRTKWLALVYVGGKYMWDYFGKAYSDNPSIWVRTGKRRSTANTTNTARFKKWARGK